MDLSGFFSKWNKDGVPLPMVRDPKTARGSISATLVVCSAALCMLCILLVACSAVAKVSGLFLNFADAQQSLINAFNISFQFFIASIGAYLGRKFQRDSKGAVVVEEDSDKAKAPVNEQ